MCARGRKWINEIKLHPRECLYTLLYEHNPSKRWLFPVYFENEEGVHFTPFYGRSGGGSKSTNTYFAAGLAGIKSGKAEGGWLFPFSAFSP